MIAPRIGKRVAIIDSSVEAARHLKSLLDADPALYASLRAPGVANRHFVSDLSSPVASLAAAIFGRPVHLEKVNV